jgi:uncharacterized protein with PIN domain
MAHWENKTLSTTCASCGKELNTYVDADTTTRETWPIVGVKDGKPHTFAACTECHAKGWQPAAEQN